MESVSFIFFFFLINKKVCALEAVYIYVGFPGSSDRKESTFNAGDPGLIPGLGKYPGKMNGNPL